MKQKKVELCVPGSLIWSQINDYLDTDLIGGGKRVRHSGRAIRKNSRKWNDYLSLSRMKIKNLPKKIYLNICSNEDEVDYNELNGVTFSTEKVGVTDCDTENVPYVNAASLWHDLKEEKPPLRKWVMFRYSGGGVNPTALHYGAMSDDVWVVTRGDGTQRIEVLYECYDKIEWFDFDELK